MTLATTDIPTADVQRERAVLAGLESKLSDANARRDKTAIEISVASGKAEKSIGINAARNALPPLNRQAKAIDAEIALLRINISHAKRALGLAEAAAESAKRASTDALVRDKLFEVVSPDGRKIRHRGASQEDVQRRLQSGYSVTGQIFGANADDTGGFIPRPGFLTAMLEAYEGELEAWLAERGIIGSVAQAPELAGLNNKENMQ